MRPRGYPRSHAGSAGHGAALHDLGEDVPEETAAVVAPAAERRGASGNATRNSAGGPGTVLLSL